MSNQEKIEKRLNRLFSLKDEPTIAWISSDSHEMLNQRQTDFYGLYSSRYNIIEIDAIQIKNDSLFLALKESLNGNNPILFNITNLNPDQLKLIHGANFDRELLFKLPATIVFWSDFNTEEAWMRDAPDFSDWLVYRFNFEDNLDLRP